MVAGEGGAVAARAVTLVRSVIRSSGGGGSGGPGVSLVAGECQWGREGRGRGGGWGMGRVPCGCGSGGEWSGWGGWGGGR